MIMIMMSAFDAMKLHLEHRAAPLVLSDPVCYVLSGPCTVLSPQSSENYS